MYKCLCVILALASVSNASGDMLREPALRRFLVSVTRPDGWLRDELLLQARGLSGQLLKSLLELLQQERVGGGPEWWFNTATIYSVLPQRPSPTEFPLDDDDTSAGAHLVAQREAYVATILNRQNVTQGAGGWLARPYHGAAVDDGAGECDECPNGNPAPARCWESTGIEGLEQYAEAAQNGGQPAGRNPRLALIALFRHL